MSFCPFDNSAGVGAFVTGLSQISSFFSWWGIIFQNELWVYHSILCLNYMMFPLVLYLPPPPLFLVSELLYLQSPKGGCCSITNDLSFLWEKKEEIWLSPVTNAPTPTYLFHHPFWFQIVMARLRYLLSIYENTCLANVHWWGFSALNEQIVHIVNQILFKMVNTS